MRTHYSEFYPLATSAGVRGTSTLALNIARVTELLDDLEVTIDDSILSRDEKTRVLIPLHDELDIVYDDLIAQATVLGLTANAAYTGLVTKNAAWITYLTGLSPAWDDETQSTTIDREVFRTKLNDVVSGLNDLQVAITAEAARRAVPGGIELTPGTTLTSWQDLVNPGRIAGPAVQVNSLNANRLVTGSFTGYEVSATATLSVGSGSAVSGMSGLGNIRIYAGSADPLTAPFQVDQNGKIIARKLNLLLDDGTPYFDSSITGGWTQAALTSLFRNSATRVASVSQGIKHSTTTSAEGGTFTATLDALSNITLNISYPAFLLSKSNTGTAPAWPAIVPANIILTVYERYKPAGGSYTAWTSVATQQFDMITSGSPTSTQYRRARVEETVVDSGGEPGVSSIYRRSEFIDAPTHLTKSVVLSARAAGEYQYLIIGPNGGIYTTLNAETTTITLTDDNGADFLLGGIGSAGSGGAPGTFTYLSDTPSAYSGAAGYLLRVNTAMNAVEFINPTSIQTDWSNILNKPSSFTPSSHTHAAADITTGTFVDARIPNLDAAKVTTGTFSDARIPNLDAGKITTGTFADARLSANVALLNSDNLFTTGIRLRTAASNSYLNIDTDTGAFGGGVGFRRNNVLRWLAVMTQTTEAGSNTGSEWGLYRYADNGSYLGYALVASRATGRVTFESVPYVGANVIWHAGNDGAGSGSDADLLDGQQGAWYQDLANATGTLANARLSGSYTGLVDLTGSGIFSAGRLRLSDTTDVTLASTAHAFQIGATTGLNLAMDGDEIQARNNGAAAGLYLNPHGGSVYASSLIVDGAAYLGYGNGGASGHIRVQQGGASNTGYLEFWRTGQASRDGYIGYGNGTSLNFSGNWNFISGRPTFAGNVPWDSGNLSDPARLSTTQTFTGAKTFTGGATVLASGANWANIALNADSGAGKGVLILTGGVNRWHIGAGATDNVQFSRYDDAGNYLGIALSIARSTGVATFEARPTWAGYTPWDSGNLASPMTLDTAQTVTAIKTFAVGYTVFAANAAFRLKPANNASDYGVIHWIDSANYYFLMTNNGDANGTFNSLRPFYITLSSGLVNMLCGINVQGSATFNTRPTWAGYIPWDSNNLSDPARLSTTQTFSGAKTFSGGLTTTGITSPSFSRMVGAGATVPGDIWSPGSGIYMATGWVGHNGSNELNIYSNGYRNSGGSWTSMGVAGNVGASGIGLNPSGHIIFRSQTTTPTGTQPAEVGRFDSTDDRWEFLKPVLMTGTLSVGDLTMTAVASIIKLTTSSRELVLAGGTGDTTSSAVMTLRGWNNAVNGGGVEITAATGGSGRQLLLNGFVNGVSIDGSQIWADNKIPTGLWHRSADGNGRLFFTASGATYLRAANDLIILKDAAGSNDSFQFVTGTNAQMVMRGTGPAIYLRDTSAQYGAAIYNDANVLYFLRLPNNGTSTTWDTGPNGRHPMTMNLTTGDVVFSGDVQGWSDRDLKENIREIEGSLARISLLTLVDYSLIGSGKYGRGFIAQDVKPVMPWAVTKQSCGMYSLNYKDIFVDTVGAVQELNNKVTKLEAKIENLQKVIEGIINGVGNNSN